MALVLTHPVTNEYQGYFLGGKGGQCIWLRILPPLCADCLDIWEPQPPQGLSRPVMDFFYLLLEHSNQSSLIVCPFDSRH